MKTRDSRCNGMQKYYEGNKIPWGNKCSYDQAPTHIYSMYIIRVIPLHSYVAHYNVVQFWVHLTFFFAWFQIPFAIFFRIIEHTKIQMYQEVPK